MSITVFTKGRHWTLCWASRIQFAESIPTSLRSMELYLHSPNKPSWRGVQLKHRESLPWESNSQLANQDVPRVLCDPEVHYHFHKSRHWSLSWASWIQSTTCHISFLRSIRISSHLCVVLLNTFWTYFHLLLRKQNEYLLLLQTLPNSRMNLVKAFESHSLMFMIFGVSIGCEMYISPPRVRYFAVQVRSVITAKWKL